MKKMFIAVISLLLFVTGVAAQKNVLSTEEKDAILYMREEEKLARDVYDSMFSKWGVNPFGNIGQSERRHMGMMKILIDTYQLQDPVSGKNDQQGKFKNRLFITLYTESVKKGTISLTESLKVGAFIEEVDIKDLRERMKQTVKNDILETYSYLIAASENHLRAFSNRLRAQGVIYEPTILDKEMYKKIVSSARRSCGGSCMK